MKKRKKEGRRKEGADSPLSKQEHDHDRALFFLSLWQDNGGETQERGDETAEQKQISSI